VLEDCRDDRPESGELRGVVAKVQGTAASRIMISRDNDMVLCMKELLASAAELGFLGKS